jgi:hypothetical protein
MDPLLQLFCRLRVLSNYESPVEFKLASLDLYRVRKDLKEFAPYADGLVTGWLTPGSFLLLCALYNVPILVAERGVCYRWGAPTYAVREGVIGPMFHVGHLFEIRMAKPLYAASHYKVGELAAIAAKLGVGGKTKVEIYQAVKEFLNRILGNTI